MSFNSMCYVQHMNLKSQFDIHFNEIPGSNWSKQLFGALFSDNRIDKGLACA